MTDTYDPNVDMRNGLKLWAAFLALALPLAVFMPRVAMVVLAFGSLAGAEHVFRIRTRSGSAKWQLISFAMLALIALVFLVAALWFATHHEWHVTI